MYWVSVWRAIAGYNGSVLIIPMVLTGGGGNLVAMSGFSQD